MGNCQTAALAAELFRETLQILPTHLPQCWQCHRPWRCCWRRWLAPHSGYPMPGCSGVTPTAASWCRWGLVRRTKPAREEHPAKSLGKREERETRRANEPYKRINTPSPTHTRSNLAAVCCKEFKGSSVLSLLSALGSTGEAAARIWAANANNTDVLTICLFLQLKTKRSSKPKCKEMSTLKNFSSACLPRNEGLQVCRGRG